MTTKHEQILHHITDLDVGEKISVRRIAKTLEVSEVPLTGPLKKQKIKGLSAQSSGLGPYVLKRSKKKT